MCHRMQEILHQSPKELDRGGQNEKGSPHNGKPDFVLYPRFSQAWNGN